MLRTFITCLVCSFVAVMVGIYIYLRVAKKMGRLASISAIGSLLKSGVYSGYSIYRQSKNREYQFPYLVRAAEPFSHIIAEELRLCKRCKLWETAHVNEDVFSISFKLLTVTTSCEESELKELLTTELQEIYIRYFGQVHPLVYPVSFERSVITFWIATNLHGNDLIRQRANSDYYAEVKEPEVLEDV